MRSEISVKKQNLNFKEFDKFDEYQLNSVESVADMKILVGEIFSIHVLDAHLARWNRKRRSRSPRHDFAGARITVG